MPTRRPRTRPTLACALAFASAAAGGCGASSNQANVELRKENQKLVAHVADLERTNRGLEAQLKARESRPGGAVPQLPQEKLGRLYTAHGLSLGRLTGGYSEDPSKPGDQVLKVYVVPTDDDGEPLKAAGSFSVELFDLTDKGDTRLGEWDFTTEQARGDWFGRSFLYTYVLSCPWQRTPTRPDATVRVTFTDELTGRQFKIDQDVKIKPPAGSVALPSSRASG